MNWRWCRWLGAAVLLLVASACRLPSPQPEQTITDCPADAAIALQILGSGGPIADDERAASGYLLWLDGRAQVLIDAGSGIEPRFGAAAARLSDLRLIALSHLHTDHSAALPGLVKSAYFSQRQRPLAVSGPSGNDRFPSVAEFMQALFNPGSGAYRYLAGILDGSDGMFAMHPQVIDASPGVITSVQLSPAASGTPPQELTVEAMGVHHGIVPALAYRVQAGDRRIVFAGDQSSDNPDMAAFSADADVLVAHYAIPDDAGRGARSLHRTPSQWARLAVAARVDKLVLSHWMQRSLRQRENDGQSLRAIYDGSLIEATDGACIVL
ncbi:MAG: MBL fold metallo-hydrolase [Wenzhouxiangellaceae bacterium]